MKQVSIPLFLLLAGCAPKLNQAGTLAQLNIGYSQIPIPSEYRPAARLGSYSTNDLALWLTPERADEIETGSVSSSAPFGNVVIELVEIPQARPKSVCETASNSFFGTDQSVQGKPLVNVFSGYRQVLYRTADAGGGCRKRQAHPLALQRYHPTSQQTCCAPTETLCKRCDGEIAYRTHRQIFFRPVGLCRRRLA